MIIYVSLLVCLLGLLVYALASSAKVAELGRIAFAMGLLAFLLGLPQTAVTMLKR